MGTRPGFVALVAIIGLAGPVRGEDPFWDIIREGQTARSTTAGGPQAATTMANTEAAYRYIQDAIRRNGSLDINGVQDLNRILRTGQSSGVGQQGGGVWRTRAVANADGANLTWYNSRGASADQRALLARYLEQISSQNLSRRAAVTAAADIHHFVVRNHMFGDGNGRTARALADWVLMKNGLPPAHHAGVTGITYDRLNWADSPELTRAQTRRYFAAATRAAEANLAARGLAGPARPPTGAPAEGPIPAGRNLPVRAGVTPVTPIEPPLPVGTARPPVGSAAVPTSGGVNLLGLRTASTVTRVGHTVALAGGLHVGGKLIETAMSPEGFTAEGAARNVFSARSGLQLLGGFAGYVLAEKVAANALAAMVPIPGVGRLVAKPLIQMALRGTAGVMGAQALSHAATGDKLDPVDLVGGSVASGVGMAIGTALMPGVGTVVGGIVGGLAWDLGSRTFRNRTSPPAPVAMTSANRRFSGSKVFTPGGP